MQSDDTNTYIWYNHMTYHLFYHFVLYTVCFALEAPGCSDASRLSWRLPAARSMRTGCLGSMLTPLMPMTFPNFVPFFWV